MIQDEVLNLDNMIVAAREATREEREENRRKKQEQAETSTKESNCKHQERWRNSIKDRKNYTYVQSIQGYMPAS